ncbi:hypothetical protein L2E82_19601 [Cichorium intybus]|uniref:Uncharacterized protein n=1 Tax=Cichorium intybus TaxID=13427 RepID=A0ACB9FCE7_CICIN|nr:hypothetical protein L2E82_19601 [Cichorium intybus]
MILSFAGEPYLIECPLPKAWHHTAACDEHDSLTIESKEVRCLMLLIIDPEFRRDLEFLGSDKLAQLVEERFREPVDKERTRIFKELEECKLEGSSACLHYYGASRNDPDRLDRLFDVSNWESTSWDTVTERLEKCSKAEQNESPKDPEDRILESVDLESVLLSTSIISSGSGPWVDWEFGISRLELQNIENRLAIAARLLLLIILENVDCAVLQILKIRLVVELVPIVLVTVIKCCDLGDIPISGKTLKLVRISIPTTWKHCRYMASGFIPQAPRKKGNSDSQNVPKVLDFVNGLKDSHNYVRKVSDSQNVPKRFGFCEESERVKASGSVAVIYYLHMWVTYCF